MVDHALSVKTVSRAPIFNLSIHHLLRMLVVKIDVQGKLSSNRMQSFRNSIVSVDGRMWTHLWSDWIGFSRAIYKMMKANFPQKIFFFGGIWIPAASLLRKFFRCCFKIFVQEQREQLFWQTNPLIGEVDLWILLHLDGTYFSMDHMCWN